MKTQLKLALLFMAVLYFIFAGCKKNATPAIATNGQESGLNNAGISSQISGTESGATQISGLSFYDERGECSSNLGQGADFALKLTGDLEGCLYAFVDEYNCSPSGTYREQGRELFVGTYKGEAGTFWTDYKFEGRYEACAVNGSYLGAEIFGRCHHPIVEGSGTGVFGGVTGRLDFKDDIEAGNFPFRGHLKF